MIQEGKQVFFQDGMGDSELLNHPGNTETIQVI